MATFSKLAKIKKEEDAEAWLRHKTGAMFVNCYYKSKFAWCLLRTVWHFLEKLKVYKCYSLAELENKTKIKPIWSEE